MNAGGSCGFMRYLNGFVVIGIVLLGISIAGMVGGNAMLTEPGDPVHWYMWLLYLAAAILMFVNGYVSIRAAQHAHQADPTDTNQDDGVAAGDPTVKTR